MHHAVAGREIGKIVLCAVKPVNTGCACVLPAKESGGIIIVHISTDGDRSSMQGDDRSIA